MTNKEIEQKIQESADNLKMRDFDEIWSEIGPQITAQKKKRHIKWKRWMPIAASFICVTVAALPFVLPNVLNKRGDSSSLAEIRYLDSELEKKSVQKAEFFTLMDQSELEIVDLFSFEFLNSSIYHTIDNKTKGGYIEAYKEQAEVAHYFILNFYDLEVEISSGDFSNFDLSYITKTGLSIDYKYNGVNNAYYIQAQYKNVNYYMQYTPGGGEITEFFEEFFQ